MTYYEELLEKRGLKLTEQQISARNAWFVSQNDPTRRFRAAEKKSTMAKYTKQTVTKSKGR